MTDRITIVEVSPRDGLQNEKRVLNTSTKVTLVNDLVRAGLRRIEVTSFVHPQLVPQMADAEALIDALGSHKGVSYIALVLNERGAKRAVASKGVDELNYVVPVTDGFGHANQGVNTNDALAIGALIGDMAAAARLRFSITLAVAFGCPFDGEVTRARLGDVIERAVALHPDELVLADTIGCAVPRQVHDRVTQAQSIGDMPLRVHFHDTRRTGLANADAAVQAGVRIVDSSAGGLGGCPFAPGSAGNIATEDLAWLLARSGCRTDVDIEAVLDGARRVCDALGIAPRSALDEAGVFPPRTLMNT